MLRPTLKMCFKPPNQNLEPCVYELTDHEWAREQLKMSVGMEMRPSISPEVIGCSSATEQLLIPPRPVWGQSLSASCSGRRRGTGRVIVRVPPGPAALGSDQGIGCSESISLITDTPHPPSRHKESKDIDEGRINNTTADE